MLGMGHIFDEYEYADEKTRDFYPEHVKSAKDIKGFKTFIVVVSFLFVLHISKNSQPCFGCITLLIRTFS